MFKKPVVIATTAAAALLALSPLAFASSETPTPDVESHGSPSLLNLSDNDLVTPVEACNNDFPINGGVAPVQGNVKDLTGALAGSASLLGSAEAENEIQTDSDRTCDTSVVNQD